MGNSTCTRTHTHAKPVPVLTGMGSCGYVKFIYKFSCCSLIGEYGGTLHKNLTFVTETIYENLSADHELMNGGFFAQKSYIFTENFMKFIRR